MSACDDYPNLIAFVEKGSLWRAQWEARRALDEIDSLRAALQLSQDARRGTR